ncbi:MAG TPA: hypothetical protein VNB24_06875 [Acidimicrobiales bacterium]|nr:hypothetical protein [Acidimicrobiales bacterium]
MSRTTRLVALFALSALVSTAAAPPAPATSAPLSTLRQAVAAEARAVGIDPELVFAATISVGQPQADGTMKSVEANVGALLDELSALGGSSSRGSGPAGTSEVVVGDTLHVWVAAGSGSQLLSVTDSALVPSTPPVILPPPATTLAFDAGGPVRHIVGDYDFGLHTVGTVLGSNVSTDSGSGAPAWLPVVSGGFVQDNSIDFLGHALFVQGQACFFGFCFAAGALLGDGAVLFDNTFPLALPSIP